MAESDRVRSVHASDKQSALLDETIQTIAQGVVVYDANERLVAFNAQFAELFEFPRNFLRPGMPIADIIRYRAERGLYGEGEADEQIDRHLQRSKLNAERSGERTLPNGKAYIYHHKPMADGGFVTTYTDITERKRAEREAAAKTQLLEATFQNMIQGIAVFDHNHTLVAFNPQFLKILTLPSDIARAGICRRDIVRFRAERGDYRREDAEEIVREHYEESNYKEKWITERSLSNGTVYDYHRQPLPGGGYVVTYTDITERKKMEGKLRESEEKFRGAFENAGIGIFIRSADGKSREFNRAFCDMMGYSADELRSMRMREIAHPDDDPEATSIQYVSFGDMDTQTIQRRYIRKDGKVIWCNINYKSVYDLDGRPLSTIGMFQEITERKRAEQEAEEKSRLLETTINTMAQGYVVYDADLRLVAFNAQYEKMFQLPPAFLRPGLPLEDVIRRRGTHWLERADSGNGDRIKRHVERAKDPAERTQERNLTSGLTYIYHRKPLPGGGFMTTYTDITERKRVERESAEKSRLLENTLENMGHGFCVFDAEGKLVAFNQKFVALYGFPPGFVHVGMDHEELVRYLVERGFLDDENGNIEDSVRRRVQSAKLGVPRVNESKLPDGTYYRYSRVPLPDGGFVATYTDVTERKQAEQKAAEKSLVLEATFENMVQGIAVYDADHALIAFNSQYAEILGLPSDFLHTGMNRREIIRFRARQGHYGASSVNAIFAKKLASANESRSSERTLAGGRTYSHERTPTPDGGYILTVTNITDQREAEKKLRQAQKMEAVGQLTGGIAHDFNNLLAVSMGNVELAEEVARTGGDVRPFLATVKRASERGASLTNQLLAFSRSQTLFPEVIDAGELVDAVTDLLRRSLGETIEVRVTGQDDLWPCEVDPHQLESAILNLAINARDAMHDGGTLSIKTANISLDDDFVAAQADMAPGEYVLVKVTDTGAGMPQDVIDHVFDPFFTTKEVGRGSGLGLSMVYGFVKQSGGHVTIYSKEGEGTAIKLYLPRSDKTEKHVGRADQVEVPESRGETVLVVEDDPDVRTLSVALLSSFGYEILEAADGESALRALETTSRVNLLFTDVVLPGGMSGLELAAKVRSRFPGIAMLYTSGYTELADFDESTFREEAELLQKPYRKADLARKVRLALDRAKP